MLICAASIYFSFSCAREGPLAPAVPAVAPCKGLAPGMKRIGNRNGIQFDVSVKEFTIHEGCSDAAPVRCAFGLSTNNRSLMEIWVQGPLREPGVDPRKVFSKHIEKRSIFDDHGRVIGEDVWGYLDRGERWRRAEFPGSVAAEYRLINESDATLFDTVISSACFSASQ